MLADARELRGGASRTIITNAASLVGTTAITSVLGFGYWLLAARLYPKREIGLASAAIAAMTLLGIVGMLGLGTLLIGELKRRPGREGSLIATALLAAGSAGAVLGLVFVTTARLVSKEFEPLAADPVSIGVFALGASLTAATLVLDSAIIGLLRGSLQLVRNAVFSITKLALLFGAAVVFSWRLWLAIFATWVFGNLVSLLAIAMITIRRRHLTESHRPQLSLVRGLGRSAIAHHSLNLALQLPSLTLPLIVTMTLTATTNASFYIAWTIASFAFVGPIHLSTMLYAVGSASPSNLARNVRVTVGLAMTVSIVAAAVILVVGTPLLRVFGASYSAQAAATLKILTLAVFPVAIRSHYVALSRIHGHLVRTALLVAGGAILELGLAVMGARAGGLSGLSWAWLGALLIESLVTLPAVYRAAVYQTPSPESRAPSPRYRAPRSPL